MERIFLKLLLLILVSGTNLYAQDLSDNENDYYQNVIPSRTMTIDDFNGLNEGDDSAKANAAITTMFNQGGGTIIFTSNSPKTIYLRNIIFKSNIHIIVNPNITIRPWDVGLTRDKADIFIMGGKTNSSSGKVSNVALTSSGAKIELTGDGNSRRRFVHMISVTNFLVSGFNITDSYTVFSNIELNLDTDEIKTVRDIDAIRPNNTMAFKGIVKDIVSTKNNNGYGLVQARAAKNVLFKNLDGEGGVTIRFESGIIPAVQSAAATLIDCVARNITIRKGNIGILLGPHRIKQGRVDIRGLKGIDSRVVMAIGAGFFDAKGGVDNLGTFDSRTVVQVESAVGTDKLIAQAKKNAIGDYPCNIQTQIKSNPINLDFLSRPAPSLTVVSYGASSNRGCSNNPSDTKKNRRGCYTVNLTMPDNSMVTGTFALTEKIIGFDTPVFDCSNTTLSVISPSNNTLSNNKIYPNPTTKDITINCQKSSTINIYNLSGVLIKSIPKTNTITSTINVSELASGTYSVVITSENGKTIHKKIIIH